MRQKTNRRRLVASAGALAAITAGGRLGAVLAQDGMSTPSPVASPMAATGTITGVVTDLETNEPLDDVYVLVGWEDVQLVGLTNAEGRYRVPDVPAGQNVDVLGFREGGYRYYNSLFDANLEFELNPGETVTHDFGLALLNQPEGEPQLSDEVIDPERVMPGQEVTFAVTAKNGKGGLSREIIAANPEIGRMVLMESVGGDRFRTTVTFSSDTPPGEYPFAFFAASKECFVNSEFPMVTLHIEEATPGATPAATPAATPGASPAAGARVTVAAVDIDFNPNEFSIPADTAVEIHVVNEGALMHDFIIEDTEYGTELLDPGAETTLTVSLPAGEYIYYCSVPGHRAAGMEGTLAVG